MFGDNELDDGRLSETSQSIISGNDDQESTSEIAEAIFTLTFDFSQQALPVLPLILAALSFLQLITLCLTPFAITAEDVNSIFSYISYARTFLTLPTGQSYVGVFIAACCVVAAVFCFTVLNTYFTYRNVSRWAFKANYFALKLLQVLLLPILYLALDSYNCNWTDSTTAIVCKDSTPTMMFFGAVCSAILIALTLFSRLTHFAAFPSDDPQAVASPWFDISLCFAMSLTQIVETTTHHGMAVSIVGMVSFFACTVVIANTMPYYRNWLNWIYLCTCTLCTSLFTFSLIFSVIDTHWMQHYLYAVFVVAFGIVGVVVGALIIFWRQRKLMKNVHTMEFEKAYEADMALRILEHRLRNQKQTYLHSASPVDKAYSKAIQTFTLNVSIYANYTAHLIDQHEFFMAAYMLGEASRLTQRLHDRYLLYTRTRMLNIKKQSESESSQLRRQIRKIERKLVQSSATIIYFWSRVAKGRLSEDNLVTTMEYLKNIELECDSTFSLLRSRYSRNQNIIRLQADFADVVKHDTEMFERLVSEADRIEESNAKVAVMRSERNHQIDDSTRKSGKTPNPPDSIAIDTEHPLPDKDKRQTPSPFHPIQEYDHDGKESANNSSGSNMAVPMYIENPLSPTFSNNSSFNKSTAVNVRSSQQKLTFKTEKDPHGAKPFKRANSRSRPPRHPSQQTSFRLAAGGSVRSSKVFRGDDASEFDAHSHSEASQGSSQLRMYRKSTTKHWSPAVKRLFASYMMLYTGFLIIVGFMVISNFDSLQFYRSIGEQFTTTVQIRTQSQRGLYRTRMMEAFAAANDSTSFDKIRGELSEGTGILVAQIADLLKTTTDTRLRNIWFNSSAMELRIYYPDIQSYDTTNISPYKAVHTLRTLTQELFQYPMSTYAIPDFIRQTTGWRAIFDNVFGSLGNVLDQIIDRYSTGLHSNMREAMAQNTAIALAVAIVVFTLLNIVLLIPAKFKLSRERRDLVQLFSVIPKTAINEVIELYSRRAHNDDVENIKSMFDNRSNGPSSERKLLILTGLVTVLIMSTLITLSLTQFVAFARLEYTGEQMNTAGGLLFHMKRIQWLTAEAIVRDTRNWPNGFGELEIALNDEVKAARDHFNRFRYGDGPIPGTMGSEIIDALVLGDICTNSSNSASPSTCIQLSDAYDTFTIIAMSLWASSTVQNLTLSGRSWETMISLADMLDEPLQQLIPLLMERDFPLVDTMMAITTWVTAVVVPIVTVALVFGVFPLLISMNRMFVRCRRMVLALSPSVLLSNPQLKEYFIFGTSVKKKIDEQLKNNEQSMRTMLEASADGVVMLDEHGIIEQFNQSAQIMFQIESLKMIGRHVKTLFSDAQFGHFLEMYVNDKSSKSFTREVEVKRFRDNTTFAIKVNVASAILKGKKQSTMFIRDLTDERMNQKAIEDEKAASEKLLLSLFPSSIAQKLRAGEKTIAETYDNCTVLFADIINFTPFSGNLYAQELVSILNEIFTMVDHISVKWNVEKIKTIGDAYLAVAGVPIQRADHAVSALEMAIEMQQAMHAFRQRTGKDIHIRVGLHSGQLVGGVIGDIKYTFDIWGDTVNLANRMESSSLPDRINVSRATYDLVRHEYTFEERKVNIKGKGLMTTYLLCGRRTDPTAFLPSMFTTDTQQTDEPSPPIATLSPTNLQKNASANSSNNTSDGEYDNLVIPPPYQSTTNDNDDGADLSAHGDTVSAIDTSYNDVPALDNTNN